MARCLALRPDLVITDELFSGLSSSEVGSMVPLIEKLQVRGMTLIMVEHRLRELFRLANRVVVLDRGRKVTEGNCRKQHGERNIPRRGAVKEWRVKAVQTVQDVQVVPEVWY